ncbi:hypothetical protein RRG08_036816 [Elysia crispata]|uniref:Uncharacterized protein n=1 Tax=Elysia crispata TaxID=231223 RepID=A0AAE1CTZ1_9GAST|nr:hypothetical protein RRG08_036816 [Elysia crispata]
MKLTVLLLLLLLKVSLHPPLSEGYTVFLLANYYFGQIMNVYFMYEPHFEDKSAIESVLSIKENVTVLHQCIIPPGRGKKIRDHQNQLQGIVIPGPFDVFFQIIELPTDLITDFRFSNITPRLPLPSAISSGSAMLIPGFPFPPPLVQVQQCYYTPRLPLPSAISSGSAMLIPGFPFPPPLAQFRFSNVTPRRPLPSAISSGSTMLLPGFPFPPPLVQFRFSNVTPWRLKLTVETKDKSVFSTRYFNLNDAFIGDWLFDTQVLLLSKYQLENASLLSINASIPVYKRTQWMHLWVEPDNATYSYSLEFHRVDRGRQDLCPTDNTVGEIDLAASNNLQSFRPCEVSLNRTLMMVFAHTLPHGLIRVRVLIRETNQLVYDMRRYFEIELPRKDIPFNNISSPYADELEMPYGRDIILDASKSFYPSLESSYGTINKYHTNLRIFTTCAGGHSICQNWTSHTTQPRIEVKWQEVEDDIIIFPKLEFTIFITYDDGPTVGPSIHKEFSFKMFGLHVDMICIRNCGQYLAQEVPGIFMAKCYDCGDVDPWDIDYSWTIVGEQIPVQFSRYYIIPPSRRRKPSFLLRVIVECSKEVFNNVTTTVQKFSSMVNKRIYLTQRGSTWPDFGQMNASERAILYDTFDIKHKSFTGYINTPFHSTPVTQYFWIKSKEINKQVDVCSFVSPIHGVALFRQNVDEGDIGYQTADGFRRGALVQIPASACCAEQ